MLVVRLKELVDGYPSTMDALFTYLDKFTGHELRTLIRWEDVGGDLESISGYIIDRFRTGRFSLDSLECFENHCGSRFMDKVLGTLAEELQQEDRAHIMDIIDDHVGSWGYKYIHSYLGPRAITYMAEMGKLEWNHLWLLWSENPPFYEKLIVALATFTGCSPLDKYTNAGDYLKSPQLTERLLQICTEQV